MVINGVLIDEFVSKNSKKVCLPGMGMDGVFVVV